MDLLESVVCAAPALLVVGAGGAGGASGAGGAGGAGLVALRGLAPGRASRAVAPADILAAAAQADADPKPMYVDVDAEGYLVPAGAGARGLAPGARAGGAALVARAQLAPDAAARAALLEPSGAGWRVRVRAAVPPHAALPLWPRADLLARAAFPALTQQHKIGGGEYACDRCGAHFGEPNALRVHLFVSCAPAGALLFYSTLLRRLAAPAPLDLRSAFRPYTCLQAPAPAGPAPGALAPAALEALATAWGRGAGGAAGHACVYCGRLYSRRYGLKIHLRTHTGYKPLRCPHCRRAFGDPSNLNKHVKLHAGGAGAGAGGAHGCALCGKALARRRDLERHMRARHAPAPAP